MQPYFSSCLVIRSERPLRSEQPASVLEIEQRLVCPKCCESVATLPAFWRVSLCTILDIKLIYNSSLNRDILGPIIFFLLRLCGQSLPLFLLIPIFMRLEPKITWLLAYALSRLGFSIEPSLAVR